MDTYYELEAEKDEYYTFEYRASWAKPHFHGAVEFIFVESGVLEITQDGETRLLQAGDACFTDSFCVHGHVEKSPVKAYVLVGARKFFQPFFEEKGNTTPPAFFVFQDFPLLQTLYALFQRPYAEERDRKQAFEGIVKILLAAIAEKHPFTGRKESKQTALVCEILRYAEENVSTDLSLQALAKRFGYTEEHLSRTLKRYLREGWNAYVNRLRVRRAKEMLENGDRTVLEIAYACGFSSPNTFYRAYRAEYGEKPRRK